MTVGDPYDGLKSRVTAPARVGCVLRVMVFVAISTLVTVVFEARVPVPEDCETKNPLEILEASGTTISKKGVVEPKVILVDPVTLEGSETVMSVALSTLTTVVLSGNSELAPDTVIPCTISVVDARTTVVDEDVTVAVDGHVSLFKDSGHQHAITIEIGLYILLLDLLACYCHHQKAHIIIMDVISKNS